MGVVILDEGAEDAGEMNATDDQQMIKAFPPDRADPTLRERLAFGQRVEYVVIKPGPKPATLGR